MENGKNFTNYKQLEIMEQLTLTVKGHENLSLEADYIGMLETWCEVWEDGKRRKEKDGYFSNAVLKVKKQCNENN